MTVNNEMEALNHSAAHLHNPPLCISSCCTKSLDGILSHVWQHYKKKKPVDLLFSRKSDTHTHTKLGCVVRVSESQRDVEWVEDSLCHVELVRDGGRRGRYNSGPV